MVRLQLFFKRKMEFYKLQVIKRIQETADTCSLQMNVPEEHKNIFKYKSGQYITLKLFIDGKEERRAYSISSCPSTDNNLQITVKNIDGGFVSEYLVNNVAEGNFLDVLPPLGNFIVEPNPSKKINYVMIAGGSGITPLMSMIKSILFLEPNSNISLFYSNKSQENIIFYNELIQLFDQFPNRLNIYHFLSKQESNSNKYYGRLTPELFKRIITEKINDKNNIEFYLCGPTSLMQLIEQSIDELGFAKSKIHKESFVSSNLYDDEAQAQNMPEFEAHEIKVRVYGQEYSFRVDKDENIITAGIKNGLIFPYSCQIGACSTCRAKLISGDVYMDVREGLTDAELEQGYILTCQSHPMSDDVVVDFDY